MVETVLVNRLLNPGEYRLRSLFPTIDAFHILKTVFPEPAELAEVLDFTSVLLIDSPHEMYVRNEDGGIVVGLAHLREASETVLYLDIVHELCHVGQHRAGRNLYDQSKSYVDRETEIEAYAVTVREARRLGLDEATIADYLLVSWITDEEHERLLNTLNVRPPSGTQPRPPRNGR
jgi:hypothetical protein